MTTAMLERPCGCPGASTGPSVLGQRVKIMAGVSNAGAGGQRVHIQEGTGNWAVGRASQTVHIRGEVVECDCGITDTFTRTEASDWGTSDAGILWSLTIGGSSTASVDGSAGLLTNAIGQSIRASLNDAAAWGAFDATLEIALSSLPANTWSIQIMPLPGGADTPAGHFLLYFGGANAGDVIVNREGNEVTGSFTAGVGPLKVRVYADLTESKIKIWDAADPEPGTWNAEENATAWTAGEDLAFFSVQINGINSEVITLRVDNLDIPDVNRCVYDNFSRYAGSDWDESTPTFNLYTYPVGLPAGVNTYVEEGLGVVQAPEDAAQVSIRAPMHALWTQPEGFVGTYDFLTGPIPGSNRSVQIDLFHGEGTDPAMDIFVAVSSDTDEGLLLIYDGTVQDSVVKTDWVAGTWYRVKFERRPDTTTFRAKVYERDGVEPDWMVATGAIAADVLNSFLQFNIDNLYPGDYTIKFDNITFNTCPA